MLPFMSQPTVHAACYVPDYKIMQAQLFRGGQRLTRAITTTGNRQTFAYRTLVTRDAPGTQQTLYNVDRAPNGPCTHILIDSDDRLWLRHTDGGGNVYGIKAAAQLRSPGFYDVLAIVNTAAAVEADRLQLYINGARVASFYSAAYPPLGWAGGYSNHAGGTDILGAYGNGGSYSQYAQDLRSDTVWLDGTVPAVTDFGSFNIHGVWVPSRPAFSLAQYGTNGFFIDFANPLQPGKDVSGKGNHFTATGFDAGGKDTVSSSPTNRYATLCPLQPAGTERQGTYGDGNLRITAQQTVANTVGIADLPISRVVATYFTFKLSVFPTQARVGLIKAGALPYLYTNAAALYYDASGQKSVLGVASAYGAAWTTQEIGVCCDPVAQTVTFYRDGVSQGTIAAPQVFMGGWYPALWTDDVNSPVVSVNFGQRPWDFAPPGGTKGVCTDNLPEPDIKDPAEALAQATATGANIVAVLDAGVAHWNTDAWVEIIKRVEASEDWRVRFSDDPANSWATNNANAKGAAVALAAAGAYVGHRLRVGAKYGIWTAEVAHTTGTATTVTHGLATARNVVIATRVSAGGGDRYVRHPDMPAGILGKLNSNAQPAADGTLTAFGESSVQIAAAAASGTYRVLVLAHRPGWLEIGNYKGNGSADGAYDPMGIAPLWQFIRRLDNTGAWMQSDTAHAPVNPMVKHFDLDKPAIEISASYDLDMVAGGVKYRTAGYSSNDTNGTYLRVAIGRPVGGVCVAPATAR